MVQNKIWDLHAIIPIVSAAGGIASTWNNKDAKYAGNVLFSANKGIEHDSLFKVASGGELSRILLSIKYILSTNLNLPTMIFDEIDTGVSGEISNCMANMMLEMSKNMQIIAITHLPQVAAKGNQQLNVYKKNQLNTLSDHISNIPEPVLKLFKCRSSRSIIL